MDVDDLTLKFKLPSEENGCLWRNIDSIMPFDLPFDWKIRTFYSSIWSVPCNVVAVAVHLGSRTMRLPHRLDGVSETSVPKTLLLRS